MAERAEEFKLIGNQHFKAGDYTQAIFNYTEAERADPSVVTYPSNLSAAYFQAGEYQHTIEAISRAHKIIITGVENELLVHRLSRRLAESLCQAFSFVSNSERKKLRKKHAQSINFFRDHPNLPEDLKLCWTKLDRISSCSDDSVKSSRQAFAELSVRKRPMCVASDSVTEFFTVGHDESRSILQGFMDGWRSHHHEKEPSCAGDRDMIFKSGSASKSMSFLFGGIGDARHLFLTWIGLPSVLARDLVFFILMENLMRDDHDSTSMLEVRATLAYAYGAVITPSYCVKIIRKTCQQLVEDLSQAVPKLPSWIQIDPASVAPIVACLKYWSSHSITTVDLFFTPHNQSQPDPDNYSDLPHLREQFRLYREARILLRPDFGVEGAVFQELYSQLRNTYTHVPKKDEGVETQRQNLRTKFGSDYRGSEFALFDPVRIISSMPIRRGRTHVLDLLMSNMDMIVEALELVKPMMKVEIVVSDVVQHLHRLSVDSSKKLARREGLLSNYTRAWMSNVPDYTGGLLKMAIYAVPALSSSCPEAAVGMNVLFTASYWDYNVTNFIYTYTSLPSEMLPKLLGCQLKWSLVHPKLWLHSPICLIPSAWLVEPSQWVSREELNQRNQRILLRILSPPILRDNLHSKHRPTPVSPVEPCIGNALSDLSKVQLSPWMPEIEVTVATALNSLPFAVEVPKSFPNFSQLQVYSTEIKAIYGADGYSALSYPKGPVVAIAFTRPDIRDTYHLPAKIRGIDSSQLLFNTDLDAVRRVQFIFAFEKLEFNVKTCSGKVAWRMDSRRMNQMREEGWSLCLWRTDYRMQGIHWVSPGSTSI
ncbi:hypothetical protein C8J56DRAFT_1046900 [Mycena floridula]|nr:hypothetical protein C8J56DRAFT_1046900 [Mycena floridula]